MTFGQHVQSAVTATAGVVFNLSDVQSLSYSLEHDGYVHSSWYKPVEGEW